jgi:nucleotide-binding universal stress UspA family protein
VPGDRMLGHVNQPYRAPAAVSIRRMLIATELEAPSDNAIEVGITLALATGASVHLLCVLEALMYSPPDMVDLVNRAPEKTHPEATRKMKELVQRVTARGIEEVTSSIEFGIAVDVIQRRAEDGFFDIVVLGTGRQATAATHLTQRLSIPVLAVPSFPR